MYLVYIDITSITLSAYDTLIMYKRWRKQPLKRKGGHQTFIFIYLPA